MTASAISYSDVLGFDSAVSSEAASIRTSVWNALSPDTSLSTSSTNHAAERIVQELFDAVQEEQPFRGEAGFGDDVQPETIANAIHLALMIPEMVTELPEIAIHPDGEIAFTWRMSPSWTATISVDALGVVKYAGLFSGESRFGRVRLAQDVKRAVADLLRTYRSRRR